MTDLNVNVQQRPIQRFNFRGSENVTESQVSVPANNLTSLDNDKLELSTKEKQNKKGMSTFAKIGLCITGTLVGLTAIATAISHHQCGKIAKIYKEKLVPKTFAEKLDFKEASTLEDAIKYAKEVLGVEHVDKSFTLEALNTTNRGVTDVVNKNIGQEVFIPKRYFYADAASKEDNFIAYTIKDVSSSRFGELGVNKKYFDNEYLTKELKKFLKMNQEPAVQDIAVDAGKKVDKKSGVSYVLPKEFFDLVAKFKQDPSSLSIKEKRILYMANENAGWAKAEQLGDTSKVIKFLEENNVQIDKEAFNKLNFKEQEEKIKEILKEKELKYSIKVPLSDGIETIYHEMGHLQDYAKNLKDLDMAHWKFDPIKIWKDSWNQVHKGIKKDDRLKVDELNNRWRGTTYEGYEKSLKDDPKKFKELYPDMYEHLTNDEIQKTAGKVSWYAQTSIGEYVAEVYAKMIKGVKLPDDVIALYKKYNGPMPV